MTHCRNLGAEVDLSMGKMMSPCCFGWEKRHFNMRGFCFDVDRCAEGDY